MKILITMALACLLGCASTPNQEVWYKPGVTKEQQEQDMAQARLIAEGSTGVPIGWNPGSTLAMAIGSGSKKKKMFRDAMIANGYRLVSANSVPAGAVVGKR